jgi:hypothetical protein
MIVMLSAVPGTPLRRPSDSVHACCEQNHLIMEMGAAAGFGSCPVRPGNPLNGGGTSPFGAWNGAPRRPGRLITTFRLWTTLRPVWTI